MPWTRVSWASAALLGALLALGAGHEARAQAAPAGNAAAKKKPPARRAPPGPPQASPEQVAAAEEVYAGLHQCEFQQTLRVEPNARHPAYFDVQHAKATYLMKPVLSTTGAIRLEDVKGQALLVQIAAKSMLMNVKAGRRIVDECISTRHIEATERAAQARAAAEAAAEPAAAASEPAAPAPAASAPGGVI